MQCKIQVAEELRQLRSKKRNLNKRLRRLEAPTWTDASCCDETMLVFMLSQHQARVAGEYMYRKNPHLDRSHFELVCGAIAEKFAEAPVDWLLSLLREPENAQSRKAMLNCGKFVVGWGLAQWTRSMNMDRGLAPLRCQLVQQAVRLIPPDLPDSLREAMSDHFQCVQDGRLQRRWLAAWRKRWRCKIGSLSIGSPLTKTEALAKAMDGLQKTVW